MIDFFKEVKFKFLKKYNNYIVDNYINYILDYIAHNCNFDACYCMHLVHYSDESSLIDQ